MAPAPPNQDVLNQTTILPADGLREYMRFLESLFSPDWLRAPGHHPAKSHYRAVQKVLGHFTLDYASLHEAASAILDSKTLCEVVEVTEEGLWRLRGGSSDAAIRKIRSQLNDPKKFDALLTELWLVARLAGDGHEPELLEEASFPDICFALPDGSAGYMECKCLYAATPNAVHNAIRSANRQLRNALMPRGGATGVVVLRVLPATNDQARFVTGPTERVFAVAIELERLLAGPNFRSIRAAFIVWDEVIVPSFRPTVFVTAFRRAAMQVAARSSRADKRLEGIVRSVTFQSVARLPEGNKKLAFRSGASVAPAGYQQMTRRMLREAVKDPDQHDVRLLDHDRLCHVVKHHQANGKGLALVVLLESATETVVELALLLPSALGTTTGALPPMSMLERIAEECANWIVLPFGRARLWLGEVGLCDSPLDAYVELRTPLKPAAQLRPLSKSGAERILRGSIGARYLLSRDGKCLAGVGFGISLDSAALAAFYRAPAQGRPSRQTRG